MQNNQLLTSTFFSDTPSTQFMDFSRSKQSKIVSVTITDTRVITTYKESQQHLLISYITSLVSDNIDFSVSTVTVH